MNISKNPHIFIIKDTVFADKIMKSIADDSPLNCHISFGGLDTPVITIKYTMDNPGSAKDYNRKLTNINCPYPHYLYGDTVRVRRPAKSFK